MEELHGITEEGCKKDSFIFWPKYRNRYYLFKAFDNELALSYLESLLVYGTEGKQIWVTDTNDPNYEVVFDSLMKNEITQMSKAGSQIFL